MTSSGRGKPL